MNAISVRIATTANSISTNEYLFILAMRNWLEGTPINLDLYKKLINMFSLHYIDYATKSLNVLMTIINLNSRDGFYLHSKECKKISNDEMAVVQLIGFIQEADYQNAEKLINDLIIINGQNDLMDAASNLAEVLEIRKIVFAGCKHTRLGVMPVLGSA